MHTSEFMATVLGMSDYLIEFMGLCLAGALMFRLLASRASRRDQIYFKTFARGIEKTLDAETALNKIDEAHVDEWLVGLLNRVTVNLPNRNLRFGKGRGAQDRANDAPTRFREKEMFTEFAEGKKSIVHSIRGHVDVLKSEFPPNFGELADRILDQDRQWKTVAGVPIETVSRMLDILPGLFVIGGILGTFIGIATGLPKIGMIDLNRISESSPILASFIDNIALSMRTSIFGIMFSVAMTVLNTTFPIHTQRIDVEKSVQRCLELIWNRIHGDKLSHADQRIIELLEQIAHVGAGGQREAVAAVLTATAPVLQAVAAQVTAVSAEPSVTPIRDPKAA